MHKNMLYDELVFYIEACESGSMFPKLTEDMKVYAATASNATDSSFATYCMPNDIVKGKELGTCLGDQFSVAWIEDAQEHNLESETLEQQW